MEDIRQKLDKVIELLECIVKGCVCPISVMAGVESEKTMGALADSTSSPVEVFQACHVPALAEHTETSPEVPVEVETKKGQFCEDQSCLEPLEGWRCPSLGIPSLGTAHTERVALAQVYAFVEEIQSEIFRAIRGELARLTLERFSKVKPQ